MNLADFKKAGHWPTLLAAFLYFDISFMAWVSLGPLMIYIAKEMNLPVEEKLTLVAIPVLGGALFRVPARAAGGRHRLQDHGNCSRSSSHVRRGARRRFGLTGQSRSMLFGIALGLGGASFAVALPQAGRWYPPQYQGVVHGHRRRRQHGRGARHAVRARGSPKTSAGSAVYGVLLILMLRVLAVYAFAAKDAPGAPKTTIGLADYAKMLRRSDSLLVHVLLLHHLRRLRRPRLRAAALFHDAVSRVAASPRD